MYKNMNQDPSLIKWLTFSGWNTLHAKAIEVYISYNVLHIAEDCIKFW